MVNDFDKNLNISYVEDSLPKPNNKLIIKHCICSDIVYFFIYIFLLNNPFFMNYFKESMQVFYEKAFLIYIILSPIIYFKFRPLSLYKSHNIEICNYVCRIFKQIFNKDSVLKQSCFDILKSFIPTYYEKQSMLLIFIKVFFGTLMVSSLLNNWTTLLDIINTFKQIFLGSFSWETFYKALNTNSFLFYRFTLLIVYIIDLIPFIIGYLTECAFLKNKIKTVDTSIAGLFFCLMCYPPFNSASSNLIGSNQNDYAIIYGETSVFGWIVRLIALGFIAMYAYASVALGTKASNLTNRGIVSRFPYNIVRHPAYLCKNTFWFLTTIPVLFVNFKSTNFILEDYVVNFILVMLTFIFWAWVYYMRAITEERHLMKDPDYQEYCKKVKWRFIPYVY